MAKLPYTFTICPDQETPKNFTASCAEMGRLLQASPNGDLTINQKRLGAWDAWTGGGLDAPIEEKLHNLVHHKQPKTQGIIVEVAPCS